MSGGYCPAVICPGAFVRGHLSAGIFLEPSKQRVDVLCMNCAQKFVQLISWVLLQSSSWTLLEKECYEVCS